MVVVELVCVIIFSSLKYKSHCGVELDTVGTIGKMKCVRHHFGGTSAEWGELIEVSPLANMRGGCTVLSRFMLVPGPY